MPKSTINEIAYYEKKTQKNYIIFLAIGKQNVIIKIGYKQALNNFEMTTDH